MRIIFSVTNKQTSTVQSGDRSHQCCSCFTLQSVTCKTESGFLLGVCSRSSVCVWLCVRLGGEHRPFSALTPLPSKLRALTPSPTACSTHSSILFYHTHHPTTFPLSLPTLLRLSLPSLPPFPSSSSSSTSTPSLPSSFPSHSAMVNDSRQILQEPDFAQLLLRDPNTPIVRKSRGTSTQGTSTHASSTHLAMLDEPPSASTSRAGSVRSARSKMSSYHGSLHRSRDGRWV